MRLIEFKKQSVPFANHSVILPMSRWRAIFTTEYMSVSASTPIQYSPANAPLVETRKKGHFPVSLLKNVLYISISLLHMCCIRCKFQHILQHSTTSVTLEKWAFLDIFVLVILLQKRIYYLFENCGARRAAFKPYFFLSFILGSLVKKPAFLRIGRYSSESTSRRALEIPCLIAPA